jgi:hypothetical protein
MELGVIVPRVALRLSGPVGGCVNDVLPVDNSRRYTYHSFCMVEPHSTC